MQHLKDELNESNAPGYFAYLSRIKNELVVVNPVFVLVEVVAQTAVW